MVPRLLARTLDAGGEFRGSHAVHSLTGPSLNTKIIFLMYNTEAGSDKVYLTITFLNCKQLKGELRAKYNTMSFVTRYKNLNKI